MFDQLKKRQARIIIEEIESLLQYRDQRFSDGCCGERDEAFVRGPNITICHGTRFGERVRVT